MPTVRTHQLHCASPRNQEFDHYTKKSNRYLNLPSLTDRVSKLSLYEGNLPFSSKGFSAIVQPSRCCTCVKLSKHSTQTHLLNNATPKTSNAKPISSTSNRFVSPTRTSHRTASVKGPLNQTKIKKSSESITHKLENIYISKRNLDHYSVLKELSPNCGTSANGNYSQYSKYDKSSYDATNKSDNKNGVLKKTSSGKELQLLHPGWRRVPWKSHFGWTHSHQELCKLLKHEIKKGSVESIYYSTEEEHARAQASWSSDDFLGGPSVSSVAEVLDVIRRMSEARSRWTYPGRTPWWTRRPASELSEYDADDED